MFFSTKSVRKKHERIEEIPRGFTCGTRTVSNPSSFLSRLLLIFHLKEVGSSSGRGREGAEEEEEERELGLWR